jgi:hypothetical protein
MAVREFVSNAIDRTARNNHHQMNYDNLVKQGLSIEIVENNQVRAKAGYTRVFIPLTPEISKAYYDLRWKFLIFGDTRELEQKILRKCKRDQNPLDRPKIYKKGVYVATLDTNHSSLFDYNLDDIELDESRNASSDSVAQECCRTICNHGNTNQKTTLLEALVANNDVWEFQHTWYLYYASNKQQGWQDIWTTRFGDKAVYVIDKTSLVSDLVTRRGYLPIAVVPKFVDTLKSMGIPSYVDILDKLEVDGNITKPPSTNMIRILDMVWDWAEAFDCVNNKEKPAIMAFVSPVSTGTNRVLGRYFNNTIYINEDIDGDSVDMIMTVVEEVSHHISGALDCSRDFQEFIIRWLVKVLK